MNMLLRKILENPADDAARLVYADWLEEQGEGERAEFVRVQLQIAEVRAELDEMDKQDLDQYAKRKPRLKELLRLEKDAFWSPQVKYLLTKSLDAYLTIDQNPRPSAAPFSRTGTLAKLSRGFVSEIRLPCAAFMQHAKAIFEAQPVTEVRLTDITLPVPRGSHTIELRIPPGIFVPEGAYKVQRPATTLRIGPLDSLSSACVRHGRDLAGLPPLYCTEDDIRKSLDVV